jgi:hypothetical protein
MFNPLAWFRASGNTMRRIASGEVLASDETTANFGVSRLRLTAKRESSSGETYAILSMVARGNYQYCHLSSHELDEFANIAKTMQAAVRQGALAGSAELSAQSQKPIETTRFLLPWSPFRMVGLMVVAFLLLLAVVTTFQGGTNSIPYSQLLAQIDAGNVHDVALTGQSVSGHFYDSRTFHSVAPDVPSLLGKLASSKVVVSAQPSSSDFPTSALLNLAPVILVVGAMIYMSRAQRR